VLFGATVEKSNGYREPYPESKWLESSKCSAEVKNIWSFITILPYMFMEECSIIREIFLIIIVV
jgi:hypothetical protein